VVVVAHLTEQSLPIPEICSSNPFMGEFYFLSSVLTSKSKRKKRPEMPNLKTHLLRGFKMTSSKKPL